MSQCVISPYRPGKRGYPRLNREGRTAYAHRVAWNEAFGPIPDGLCVLHRCDQPRCINPEHLFLGTRRDNSADMREKRRGTVGERNKHAKLTWKQVAQIRTSSLPTRELVTKYGVSRSTIKRVRAGSHWRL